MAKKPNQVGPVIEVTKSRDIKETTRWLLWGKAAGRCEFFGCNRPLWKSPVTQEQVNIAEAAHIYSFSSDGPRGNEGVSIEELNQLDNLMLACHDCHKTMDQDDAGVRYSVDLLRRWKSEHEKRIETVTRINPTKSSHVILYGANVGQHGSPLNHTEAAQALFPDYFPAETRIELGITNGVFQDCDPTFWNVEAKSLVAHFDRKIKQRIETGDIQHLSIFGLAPQPLLILLGSLLGDIPRSDVYQRHREPTQTWTWPQTAPAIKFEVHEPTSTIGSPALALALSGPIADERIQAVLGPDASIWRVTVPNPNNDLIKSREHLSKFRTCIREVLERINERHGRSQVLHVFPAAGVATAIEFGRVRMPKAHMPWKIYDQNNRRGGFAEALNIPFIN